MRAFVSLAGVLVCAQFALGAAPPVAEKPLKTFDEDDVPGFVGFVDSGKGLLAVGWSGRGDRLKQWSLSTGKSETLVETGGGTYRGVLSPDSKTLFIVHRGCVSFVDLEGKKVGRPLPYEASGACYAPDGKTLALGCWRDQTVHLWDVGHKKVRLSLKDKGQGCDHLAFRPDGHVLASAGRGRAIRLWDPHSGKLTRLLESDERTEKMTALPLSPNGKILACNALRLGKPVVVSPGTSSQEFLGCEIQLWNPDAGKRLKTLHQRQLSFVEVLLFSPDGKLMISLNDKLVTVWDVATWTPVRTLRHRHRAMVAAISPDSKLLAVGSWDKRIYLWKLRD